ncbi:MAG TPA: hypothetical protein VMP01_19300 [Pirellulaceae bacterium]|nr:hypothetical protein [Pirellulaceae bacterium]
MEFEDNEAGGKSIMLFASDALDDVPESHADLISPEVRRAFVDPIAYFRKAAADCPFRTMKSYLTSILKKESWVLMLHRGNPAEWNSAGFMLFADDVRTIEISPASDEVPVDWPPELRKYHSLVGPINWMTFGFAGGLGATTTPLSDFPYEFHGMSVDPTRTYIFGDSFCGDMLFYTQDGRGGWFWHETGYLHGLGSIGDTIEWVYSELLADRTPEFDYARLKENL